MGSLERRLERLEIAAETKPEGQDKTIRRETLGRMTEEELKAYEAAVVRSEAGEEPTAADRVIAARVRTIGEEVERELAQKA